jgi:hypothetical protein
MPWVVGIDEAGYGPNLGPLVQTAAAVRLPIEDLAGWDTLRLAIRKAGGRWGRDQRTVIDDSKKVYHGVNALERLERGVFTAFGFTASTVGEFINTVTAAWCQDELSREAWYDATRPVPVETPIETIRDDRKQFLSTLHEGVQFSKPVALVTPTPWFNQVVEATGSKATLLSNGLIELMKQLSADIPGEEHIHFFCDKQGGRNYYAPLLRHAFPTSEVCPDLETNSESRYRIEGLNRTISVVFRPRSDGESIAVALASMLAKYLRELCMGQFNNYWTGHLPGLEPTAGYPMDAKRFIEQIRPVMMRLEIAESLVWRMK